MRGQPPKREKKKLAGVFGAKKKQNRHKRRWRIAAIMGGVEWADAKVGRPSEWIKK